MPEPRFIHLRLHSEYSVTDGTVRLDAGKNHECPPVLRAAADGMPALALTEDRERLDRQLELAARIVEESGR